MWLDSTHISVQLCHRRVGVWDLAAPAAAAVVLICLAPSVTAGLVAAADLLPWAMAAVVDFPAAASQCHVDVGVHGGFDAAISAVLPVTTSSPLPSEQTQI